MTRRALCLVTIFLALAASLAGCREEVRELELVFGAGNKASDGLACSVDDRPLLADALEGDRSACLVVDVVPTDGQPGCRLSELLAWCSGHDCEPDADLRVRIDLTQSLQDLGSSPVGNLQNPGAIANFIKQSLSGTVLFEAAPDEIAMLRATIVGLPCDEVDDGPRFACHDVLACLYSCPVSLNAFEGSLVLDLDALSNDSCVRDVRSCAADRMFDRDQLMSPCDTNPLVP